jgi:hypothetical protein
VNPAGKLLPQDDPEDGVGSSLERAPIAAGEKHPWQVMCGMEACLGEAGALQGNASLTRSLWQRLAL